MTAEERARQSIEQSAIPPQFSQWWAIAISPEQTEALIQSIAQALRDQIEDCAKLTDDESIRLDVLGIGYKQRGELVTATRYSACIITAAKLGRDIRALAAPTEQTEGKGIER